MGKVWACDTCARYLDDPQDRIRLTFNSFGNDDHGFIPNVKRTFCSWRCVERFAAVQESRRHPSEPPADVPEPAIVYVPDDLTALYRFMPGWGEASRITSNWRAFCAGENDGSNWELIAVGSPAEVAQISGDHDTAPLMQRNARTRREVECYVRTHLPEVGDQYIIGADPPAAPQAAGEGAATD
jgi:hypothetical protein